MKNLTKSYLEHLAFEVIGAAIEVHRTLGTGLLESIYHRCMEIELEERGIAFETEYSVDLVYKGRELSTVVKCDLLIEGVLVVELKSVKQLLAVHDAQTITYMKLLDVPKGLLINFYCANITKEGLRSFVSEAYRHLPD